MQAMKMLFFGGAGFIDDFNKTPKSFLAEK